jgi:glucan phosphoethanolaminetransferase (alkaline phosphatase superfamily)
MELFLNLCWLALVLPAYVLWQQRISSGRSVHRSLVIVGALMCALIVLFPVISASDDLHSSTQAIEESKRTFRQGSPPSCSAHSIAHASSVIATASVSLQIGFEQLGSVPLFAIHTPESLSASASAGRSPPLA